MPLQPDLPHVDVISRDAWRAWLSEHHATSQGVWAVTYKKAHLPLGDSYVSAQDLNEECLCFGWIDSKPGRITPAGHAAAEAARSDGSWDRLADVDGLIEPADLSAALDANRQARECWDAFPPSARRGILEWILNAKRPQTRAQRIEATVSKAARNERALAWRPQR